MKQWIDLETWNRRHLFNSYFGTDFPYINIGCELDITKLYAFTKANRLSLYFSMIWLITKAANEIENFHYRFEDGRPYRIESNVAFATHLRAGEDIFTMVECDPYDSMSEYARKNREKADLPRPNSGLSEMKGRADFLNITCIPWVHYTHFVRTIKTDGVDCVPKISMGKFKKTDSAILMPFSVQCHHGLMDGYHVGKYIELMESWLEQEIWLEGAAASQVKQTNDSDSTREIDAEVSSTIKATADITSDPTSDTTAPSDFSDAALNARIREIKLQMHQLAMELPLTYRTQLWDDIRRVEQLMGKRKRKATPKIETELAKAVLRLNVSAEHILNQDD